PSRSLLFGLRLFFLAHDDNLLTVHLDGAPVGGRLALGLRSAALPPLSKLLLQILEHTAPPADPASVAGRPARGPAGLRLRYCRCTKVSSARARFGLRSLRS